VKHLALDLIQRLERMWAETDQIAFDRARVIVKALIEVKLIRDEFRTDDAPDDHPKVSGAYPEDN
jgi:hypothetical protein